MRSRRRLPTLAYPHLSLEVAAQRERMAQRRLTRQHANAVEQMEGFDELPAELRCAMQGQIVSQTVFPLRLAFFEACRAMRETPGYSAEVERRLPRMFAQAIADWDEHEVRCYSASTARRYGHPSPHVAARATIQRPK